MEITILTPDERFITLNVNPSVTVEDLKSLLGVETGVTLLYDGKHMIRNSRRLSKYGVGDGDLVVMNHESPSRNGMRLSYYQFNGGYSVERNNVSPPRTCANELGFNPDGSAVNASAFRQHILKDRRMMDRICMNDPELGEIILNDESKYSDKWLQWYLRTRHCQRTEWMRHLQNEEWALHSDKPLYGIIKSWDYGLDKNWGANLQQIRYYTKAKRRPRVCVEINGVEVEDVLVDTGASGSAITRDCAGYCGLEELIDKDHRSSLQTMNGTTIPVVGMINITTVKIGDISCLCSFDVVESNGGEQCVLGMDLLHNYKCIIDLDAYILKTPGSAPVPCLTDDSSEQDSASIPNGPGTASISSRYTSGSSRTRELRGRVSRLVELGFAKQACINALKAARGNEELAAEFLFGC